MPNEESSPGEPSPNTNVLVREAKISSTVTPSNAFQPGEAARTKLPGKVKPSTTSQPASSGNPGTPSQAQTTGGQQQGSGKKE